MSREIVLVSAVSEGNVIGNNGRIPWWDDKELRREDMNRFRKLTLDKPIIMGHSTYLSIGKVLPKRTNIILSRKENLCISGASVCNDLSTSILMGHAISNEIYIVGGGEIYRQTIQGATRLEMTEIDGKYEGDTFFPEYKNTEGWREISRDSREGFSFVTYSRMRYLV